ncbi:MAG: FAD-binding and (Fe-S)-binding domain-containing protein [Burkholderiaceae bacterium]
MNAPAIDRRAFLAGSLQTRFSQSQLASRLRREVQGDLYFDEASRGRYSTDASIYQIMPIGVVVPKTPLDLRIALDIARDAGVAVLPRGGGTSQCGQTVGEALVIDTSKYLRNLLSVDVGAMRAEVQPGLVLDHLNAQLKSKGVWFPVDVSTAAQCTIGGMTGNNSCGSRSLHYGNMVHNVLGINAILDDGTQAYFGRFGDGGDMQLSSRRLSELVPRLFQIADSVKQDIGEIWPKVMRRVGGYNLDIFHPQSERPYTSDGSLNLAHLLVGSEGTLATFESIALKLSPLPKHKRLGVVNFPTFQQAMALTKFIVGLKPVAVELVDRTMIELCRANPLFAPVIADALVDVGGRPTDALLLVEFAGDDVDALMRGLDDLDALMADHGLPGATVKMVEPARQSALWEVRKAGLNIMMSLRGDGKPVSFIEDCAVPLEHLDEYTDSLTRVFAKHGTQGTWYAHASVGTLHVRPILDMRRGGAEKMRAIAEEAGELVRRYKGAFSGEHGDGLVRSEWVSWQFGPRITQAFEQVKDAFDPANRLNPGKIVRSTKMDDTSLFRFPPSYAVTPFEPVLDWSAWNVQNDPSKAGDPGSFGLVISDPGTGGDPAKGYAKAIEMCNNNGHCRKFDAGTMCPSYRATRDEQHSVRGRANTLRLAVSGQLSEGLDGPAVQEALALCVGCKGCKRECPTGVDMAKMKIEALYQHGKRHGFSVKQRLIAGLPGLAAMTRQIPGFAALLNLRNQLPGLPWLGEKLFGLAASRRLPSWAMRGFRARSRSLTSASLQDCDLVLWADTFNDAYEPEQLVAAYELATAMGYRVALSGAAASKPLCCGRSALSVGMVDQARQMALDCLEALAPAIDRGVPVVGLEPSCILSLRDEWLVMHLGERANRLAKQALLFEEWWVAEQQAGRLKGGEALADQTVYVHGHCHQKAMGALSPTIAALQGQGAKVVSIESSCCGMAGSFGYEAAHQAVSKAMAQASLLPAVASAPADALLVADGFSCRHQIADLSTRQAEHAVMVLHRAICPAKGR